MLYTLHVSLPAYSRRVSPRTSRLLLRHMARGWGGEGKGNNIMDVHYHPPTCPGSLSLFFFSLLLSSLGQRRDEPNHGPLAQHGPPPPSSPSFPDSFLAFEAKALLGFLYPFLSRPLVAPCRAREEKRGRSREGGREGMGMKDERNWRMPGPFRV